MKRYVIWNPQKLSMFCEFDNKHSLDTYAGLREMEKNDDCSWSSEVYTDDIAELHQAIYNETDVDLSYKEIIRHETDNPR